MPKPAALPKFIGFDRDAMQFLHELTAEMNREWFEANKPRYQARWVEPMTALLTEVRQRLAKAYAPIKLGPPKLFRIYRDTRFSKDKSPYKTHVAGMLPLREGCTAMYMHIGIDEEFVGVGTYYFEDTQLPRWRKLVAADKTGKEIAGIVGKLRKAGYQVGGHEDYKKVPKGFAPDHPRAEFLKMRGLTGGFPDMPKGLLHKPALADWLVKHATATAPLVSWLYRNIK
jgi:uncharacterized protein (TIGR02453 family)